MYEERYEKKEDLEVTGREVDPIFFRHRLPFKQIRRRYTETPSIATLEQLQVSKFGLRLRQIPIWR